MNQDLAYLAKREAQIALEQEAVTLGIERYRDALEAGEDTMPPGMKLLKAAIVPLAAGIKAHTEAALAGKAVKGAGVVKFINQFSPEAVAFVTAKRVLHGITDQMTLTALALQVATALEDSVNHEALAEADPAMYRRLLKRIATTNSDSRRHIVLRQQQKYVGIEPIRWGLNERARMGTLLVHLMVEHTGLVELVKTSRGARDTPVFVVATQVTLDWLEKSHARCELMAPASMPMVVPPTPWTTPFDGGYLTKPLQYSLIKTANKNYLEELTNFDMPMVYASVNALQRTAWAVNEAVLHVAREVWDGGGRLGKLPAREPEPLPGMNHDPDHDKEAHKAWRRMAAQTYERNVRSISKRLAVESKLGLAERLAPYGEFFYPHALDWRGRAYPVSAHLNPQGDDLAKGLLQFAKGKPLGDTGATWLAVHGANCFGVDKVDFGDRVQWVKEHHDAILDSAFNPLDGARLWAEASSPYQFLAFCFEWAGYSVQGDSYVSRLPVSWDGSCNGLQNFSAMLRDEVGGAATNLTPSETPADIYAAVAKEAQVLIDKDAAEGSVVALRWTREGAMNRKVTKRNTMTVPYGVSRHGMTDQLLKAFQKAREEGSPMNEGQEFDWDDALYLAGINHKAIGLVVVAARAAMDWLMAAAKVVAADGLPVRWTTPSGLLVQQDYRELVGHEADFVVAGKRYRMMLQITGDKLDRRKQGAGISPNFVHSLDAAHMMRTVVYCQAVGMDSFAMVHDSYGAHASDAEELSYQLRRAFVDQYAGDVLGDFRQQLVEQVPEELAAKIPPLPPMGTLELEAVMDSNYFFA